MAKKTSEIKDRLEKLAYKFKETELWDILSDSDIFGVQLEDGRIAYCCVMGSSGVHKGLGVFVGNRGFKTYLDSIDDSQIKNAKVMFERMAGFENIQLSFSDEGRADFWCQHPHQVTEPNNYTDNERVIMHQALEACIALHKFINVAGGDVVSFGFDEYEEYPTKEGGKEAPLLTRQDDGYSCTTIKLPAYDKSDEQWVEDLANKALKSGNVKNKLGRLIGIRKIGTLQCRLIHCPSAIKEKDEQLAYFPHTLLAVKQSNGIVLKPEMALLEDEGGAQDILINFFDSLEEEGCLPLQISVPDELTERFLSTFCRHMGIKLVRTRKPLKELNQVWESLFQHFSSGNAYENDDEDEDLSPYSFFPLGTA